MIDVQRLSFDQLLRAEADLEEAIKCATTHREKHVRKIELSAVRKRIKRISTGKEEEFTW